MHSYEPGMRRIFRCCRTIWEQYSPFNFPLYCACIVYCSLLQPWYSESDSENVLFVSVHGYGPRERGLEELMPYAAFYPGSGKTSIPAALASLKQKTPAKFATASSVKLPLGDEKKIDDDVNMKFSKVKNAFDKDEDDDEEDDSDSDYNEEEDDEDSYDAMVRSALEEMAAEKSSSKNVYTQILRTKTMFNTLLLSSSGDRELVAAKDVGMTPLILGTTYSCHYNYPFPLRH